MDAKLALAVSQLSPAWPFAKHLTNFDPGRIFMVSRSEYINPVGLSFRVFDMNKRNMENA